MKKNRKVAFAVILAMIITIIPASLSGCADTDLFRFAMDTKQTEIASDTSDTSNGNIKSSADNAELHSKPVRTVSNAKLIAPSDFISAVSPQILPQDEKAYTIMIYMNGSDLESKYQSATDDILEMFESDYDSDNINIIIFTGGTVRWHTQGIPNRINAIFKLDPETQSMIKLAEVGKSSMGSPEVLAGFMNLCYKFFPAKNYGLIFWNHGGGAVIGYGSDERYEYNPDRAMMRLSEIDSALASSDFTHGNQILEFIGFDTCLMATIEMACIAEKYARYMIASEELEPGPGWDYYFLGEIAPDSSGYDIGRMIIDYYEDFYIYSDEKDITTLSMTNLSEIQAVADAFENLAAAAGGALASGEYNTISKARSKSRMFGGYEEHGGGSDMIDAALLAESLILLLPEESAELLGALERAVVYKHENNVEDLGGLSIYFPFTNKQDLDYYISIYKSMNQLPNYTGFIEEFSNILMSNPRVNYRSAGAIIPEITQDGECVINITEQELENLAEVYLTVWQVIQTEAGESNNSGGAKKYLQVGKSSKADIQGDGSITLDFDRTWSAVNGVKACLYELARSENHVRYAIPARLNGEDADLIAIYSDEYPNGKIIGAVPTNEGDGAYNSLNKKMVRIQDGDIIKILYYSTDDLYATDTGNLWHESGEIIVDGELMLSENADRGEYLYGITLVDTQRNDYNTGYRSATAAKTAG